MDRFTVKSGDIFKAAYLFQCCDCELSVGYQKGVGVVFTLTGETVKQEERTYVAGDATVDVMCLKESVLTLLEKSGQTIRPL